MLTEEMIENTGRIKFWRMTGRVVELSSLGFLLYPSISYYNTPDTASRSKIAEGRFNLLMYFGDNLRDFPEEFVAPNLNAKGDAGQKQATNDRLAKTPRANYCWGKGWIVLPNQAYGELARLLGNNTAKIFRSTEMRMP